MKITWNAQFGMGCIPCYSVLFLDYSTVTDLAKFLGWSTSVPRNTATWYDNNCSGTLKTMGEVKVPLASISTI